MNVSTAMAAIALVAAPAWAGPDGASQAPGQNLTRQVEFADLDLGSPSGARALRRRVGAAVQDLCADALGQPRGGIDYPFDRMGCEETVMREAGPQVAQLLNSWRGRVGSIAPAAGTIRIALAPTD